jgi:hypothetical protein
MAQHGIKIDFMQEFQQQPSLVGNVTDMSPRVVATPTMSAENGRRHNVANAVTGTQS